MNKNMATRDEECVQGIGIIQQANQAEPWIASIQYH